MAEGRRADRSARNKRTQHVCGSVDGVAKSDRGDYIDWDAGCEGYVQSKAQYIPVSPYSHACETGSQPAKPAEYSVGRTPRKPHRGCRNHMGGVRGDPRLRQPVANANYAAGSGWKPVRWVSSPGFMAQNGAAPRRSTKAAAEPGHPFPNGSSSDGLCGVNNSAPFSVTCISSSRRIPNSPRM